MRVINLQIEVTEFLAQKASPSRSLTKSSNIRLTLFGNSTDMIHLCSLILLSGKNLDSGFGLSFRIMQEFSLSQAAIYSLAAQNLIKEKCIPEIQTLIECIQSSGEQCTEVIDEVLSNCINNLVQESNENKEVESFIKMMHNTEYKMNAYILCGKLKSAYLLAVGSNSVKNVKRILAEAERRNQTAIKNICQKWLEQSE